MAVHAPVPETRKDAETITLSKVIGPSSSSNGNTSDEGKIVIVTPKGEFCFYFEESETIRPVQESSDPVSEELVISGKCEFHSNNY